MKESNIMQTRLEEAHIKAFRLRLRGKRGEVVKIIEVHDNDAFASYKKNLVGHYGIVGSWNKNLSWGPSKLTKERGWERTELMMVTGPYQYPTTCLYFIGVRYEKV